MFLVALLSASLARQDLDLDGPLHLEIKSEGRVEVTITEKIKRLDQAASGWEVALPSPPSLDGQGITKTQGFIVGHSDSPVEVKRDLGPFRQAYLYGKFKPSDDADARAPEAQGIYELGLFEKRLVAGAGQEKPFPLSSQLRSAYTSATSLTPISDKTFLDWLKDSELAREDKETDCAYAYRALTVLAKGFKQGGQYLGGSAVDALGREELDPSAASALYAAVLKAGRLPARVLVEVPLANWDLLSTKQGAGMPRYATVEFFANDIGWVPVDVFQSLGEDYPKPYFGLWNHRQMVVAFDDIQLPGTEPQPFLGMMWRSTGDPSFGLFLLQKERIDVVFHEAQ